MKRLQLGKKGLTEEFVNQVKSFFIKEKIIKISILKSACRGKEKAKAIAEELIKKLGNNYDYKIIGYVIVVMKIKKRS